MSLQTSAQLKQLVSLSANIVQSVLADEQVSLKDRTDLALKVLTLESSPAHHSEPLEVEEGPLISAATANLDAPSRTVSSGEVEIPAPDQAALVRLAEAWQAWIVTNKQMNVSDEHLIAIMIQEGLDEAIAVQAVQAVNAGLQQPVATKTADAAVSDQATWAQLSEGWRDWLVTNKQRDVKDDQLIAAMIQEGIDAEMARQAVKAVSQNVFAPVEERQSAQTLDLPQLEKLESIFTVQRQLRALSPKSGQIERRDRIAQQEFLDRYYATNTPLILTGMLQDWPALTKWTPEYLKATYGDVDVEVQLNRDANPNYEIDTPKHKQTMTLAAYTDKVLSSGVTNDFYMVANNSNLERPELRGLLEELPMLPEFFDPALAKKRVFLWFGPAGTITPLHHDVLNIMIPHVYGRKRWRLIDPVFTPLLYNHTGVYSQVDLENPDYTKFPLFKEVQVTEAVLEPGEILFVPAGWWHQVKGLDISLSVSMTNFVFPNQYEFRNPTAQESTATAPTPQSSNHTDQVAAQAAQLRAVQTSPRNADRIYQTGEQALTNAIVDQTDACYLVDKIVPDAPLVITFGFVNWHGSPRFDFYGRTKKLENLAQRPLNRILIRDPLNAWYHRGIPGLGRTVDDSAIKLKGLMQKISPSQVTTIGQSMGAYAAIMFGQLLGVDQILAFGPLSFLNVQHAKTIGDTRWLSVMQALEENPPAIFYNDLVLLSQIYGVADMRIFYGLKPDPELDSDINLDDYHAKRLRELPGCKLYPYQESCHPVVQYLKETQQIDGLLLDAIFPA